MSGKKVDPQPHPKDEPGVQRAAQADPTPPPDHDGFVEARSNGLRAVRANLARRQKTR